MDVCIHRGSRQIGGSCVEIRSGQSRILVDFGLPLDADEGPVEKYLPPVAALDGSDPGLLEILISHPHLDHFGLLSSVSRKIPVGMGVAARRILAVTSRFLPGKWPVPAAGHDFTSNEPFDLGPFRITPYLVDHSAFDSYALLIQVDGKNLFYSGDFRAHGRKGKLFDWFSTHSPAGIDVLLLEGSSLGRIGDNERFRTETEIETDFVAAFRDTKGLALVYCSSQNIDRVVTIFRACLQAGRKLVIDLYTAAILEATGNSNIPQSDWSDIVLYVPEAQRQMIKRAADREGSKTWYDLLKKHSKNRLFIDRLEELQRRATVLFRPLHMGDLEARPSLMQNSIFINSQWSGYWEDSHMERVRNFLTKHDIPKIDIHTSGHASPADLQAFSRAIAPKKIVPIHSFDPERYSTLFPDVESHTDGEWWTI